MRTDEGEIDGHLIVFRSFFDINKRYVPAVYGLDVGENGWP